MNITKGEWKAQGNSNGDMGIWVGIEPVCLLPTYQRGSVLASINSQATRKANARYVLPTEDEWYKAAYHKNDGTTGNYFDYPTSSDVAPSNQLIDPDPGNNANFDTSVFRDVGAFENSASPYGTFDQGGWSL